MVSAVFFCFCLFTFCLISGLSAGWISQVSDGGVQNDEENDFSSALLESGGVPPIPGKVPAVSEAVRKRRIIIGMILVSKPSKYVHDVYFEHIYE